MALTTIPGWGAWVPDLQRLSATQGPVFTNNLIDANGEMFGNFGSVWTIDRGTHTLGSVSFPIGTVSKGTTTVLTVTVGSVSLTTGPPMSPDLTSVVMGTLSQGQLTTSTWVTASLGTSRSTYFGERLAILASYSTFNTGDQITTNNLRINTALHSGQANLYTSAGWSATADCANIILEFTDGTYGTLDGGWPCATSTETSFSNVSSPNEYGMAITLPVPVKVDGLGALVGLASGANFDINLYSGTTTLSQTTVDGNTTAVQNTPRFIQVPTIAVPPATGGEISLTANTEYIIGLRPTTSTNIKIYDGSVSNVNHWGALPLGATVTMATRTAGGTWQTGTANLRRPFFSFRISSMDNGAGGAGTTRLVDGGLVNN